MKHIFQAAKVAAVLAGVALIAAHVRPAQAQDFSGKPIRIIVGLVAGGATDVTARMIAQKLTESLHTNVYVENKPGAAFRAGVARTHRRAAGRPYAVHDLGERRRHPAVA